MQRIGGHTEVDTLLRVVLKHTKDAFPTGDLLDAQWQELGYRRKPDPGRAEEEHDYLIGLMEELGVQVELLPPHPEAGMDSIYVRDASILTNKGIVLCNMGKDARGGEPGAQGEVFESLEIPILGRVEGDGRIEGGDVVWLGPGTVAVGRGYRTNDEGIRQLRVLLEDEAEEVVVVPLPHWRGQSDVFHLMSVVSPIDHDLALVYSPLIPVPFRELLLRRGISLVEVPDQEFDSMGCNVLTLAPRVCVALEGNPETIKRLEVAGVEVHTYPGEEISVPGEGGPTCLTRPLLRRL